MSPSPVIRGRVRGGGEPQSRRIPHRAFRPRTCPDRALIPGFLPRQDGFTHHYTVNGFESGP
jgi:hypothetical protein